MSRYPRIPSFKSRKKMLVGITSRSHEDNFQWLKEFIMNKYSDLFEVRHFPITNSNRRDWEEAVRTCSTVILYHTKHQGRVNVTDVDGALYDAELSYLNHCLGKENVLVVLDDMDDISDNERQRILKAQRSLERLSSHLILISERNKVEAANRKLEELFLDLSEGVRRSPMEEERPEHKPSSSKTPEPSSWDLGKYFTSSSSSAPSSPRSPPHPTYRVGIFSRSAESNYTWLVEGLKADGRLRSDNIRAFYISNHYETFSSELLQCHFAILYHTKKHRTVNITDVTRSLHDMELQDMSGLLGKENVIVVVDDLESSGPEERDRILDSQLSIRKFARDLFLFTETEKQTQNLEEIRGIIQRRVRKSPMEEETPQHKPSSSKPAELLTRIKNIGNNIKDLGKYLPTNPTLSSTSAPSRPRPPPRPTYRVGIFSRSAESNYMWLVANLKVDGRLRSADIKPFYISNHYPTFRSGLQQCHFAVLYHTKKQGRINITDVTDSLYDKELQDMSGFLGKQNVIVVVDDLESSGSEEKDRILDSQLSIRKYAEDLFLFTETEKHTKNLEEIRGIIQRRLPNVTGQRSVPDTAHPPAAHRDGESITRVPGSSVDNPMNRTSQVTPNISSSCSESVSLQPAFHKNDTREPKFKRLKTLSPSEETNSMEVTGDLSQLPSSDLLDGGHMKCDKSHQENEDLRGMIEELKQKNLSQEETIQELITTIETLTTERDPMERTIEEKEKRSQNIEQSRKKGEAKVQGEEIGMKPPFQEREGRQQKHRTQPQEQERLLEKGQYMKGHLQNTAGSSSLENQNQEELITGLREIINEKNLKIQKKEEEIQRQRDEIQRKEEEIRRQRDEIQRKEEEIQGQRDGIKRKEEEIRRQRDEIKRKEEEIRRQRDEIQRKEEEIRRQRDEIQRKEEEIRRQREEIQRKEEEIQGQRDEIQRKEEEIRRQRDEIQRQRDKIQRKEEEIQRQREEIKRKEEEIRRQRDEIQRKEEEIWRQRDEIQRKEEEIQGQRDEILNYEYIHAENSNVKKNEKYRRYNEY